MAEFSDELYERGAVLQVVDGKCQQVMPEIVPGVEGQDEDDEADAETREYVKFHSGLDSDELFPES